MSRVFLLLQDAHPDDGGDAAQLLAQAGIHGAGGVQHGVGHALFALVHHVFDVQAGLGSQGSDLADHARLILVDDADAFAAGAGLMHLRQVDRVGNVAVAQVIAQLLRRHDGAVVLGFRGLNLASKSTFCFFLKNIKHPSLALNSNTISS